MAETKLVVRTRPEIDLHELVVVSERLADGITHGTIRRALVGITAVARRLVK